MDDSKIETQVKSTVDGDTSTGETKVLSKDEQHLAKLGYKQGLYSMRDICLEPKHNYSSTYWGHRD